MIKIVEDEHWVFFLDTTGGDVPAKLRIERDKSGKVFAHGLYISVQGIPYDVDTSLFRELVNWYGNNVKAFNTEDAK